MNSNFCGTDLYSVLGVKPSASKAAIKAAFRALAKKYHPDINKNDKSCEKKFKDIAYAYEVLSNDLKRKDYDKQNGFNQPKPEPNAYSNPRQAQHVYERQTSSSRKTSSYSKTTTKKQETDFAKNFSKFVSEIFASQEQPMPVKGSDIDIDLAVTIQEAQLGTSRRINVMHTECCPVCKGKNFLNDAKCTRCNGEGEISTLKTIMINIPAGSLQGSVITLKNEGNKGKFGGKNGDLHLKIIIKNSDVFRFDGLNVLSDIPISPTEAALGATVTINTISGTVSMKIPPETSSGQKFRLHNQGIFDKDKNICGDHIVKIFIKIPKNLSHQEKELYNKLAKLRDFNPRNEEI